MPVYVRRELISARFAPALSFNFTLVELAAAGRVVPPPPFQTQAEFGDRNLIELRIAVAADRGGPRLTSSQTP
jgi:hypothetical protein